MDSYYKVDIKKPFRVVRPNEERWIAKHKFVLIIALMGEASSEVAISDTVAAHSHCYLPERLVQSTAAARFAPGLVIQRRQSQFPVLRTSPCAELAA